MKTSLWKLKFFTLTVPTTVDSDSLIMTFSNDTLLSSNLRLKRRILSLLIAFISKLWILPEFQIIWCGLSEVDGPLFLRHRADHSLSDMSQKLQWPCRRLSGSFRHYFHMFQFESFVVSKDDALLLRFSNLFAIVAIVAAIANRVVLKVFRSHNQTWALRFRNRWEFVWRQAL